MTLALPAMIFNDPPASKASDFAYLSDDQIFRRIQATETSQECADTEEEWCRACHDLMVLRGVLEDRGVLHPAKPRVIA